MKPFFASIALLLVLGAAGVAQTQTAPKPEPVKPGPVSLHELSQSLQELSGRVHNSVVQIFSSAYTAASDDSEGTNTALFSRQKSTGSGVIMSSDGYIVTNSHVVRGARRIEVRFPPSRLEIAGHKSILKPEGRTMEAKLVGMDRESDLAVIKVDRAGLSHLSFGNSDDLRQGELVMAFGNPLGLEGSVSMGIVSSSSRQIRPDDPMIYIQTDASINPGNSGGPLVDSDGRVMGINTFILSQSGGSEGIGFAIPSNIVNNVYTQIRKEGHVHRGQIGLYAQTITPGLAAGLKLPRDWGVLVADVTPDGPADTGGVKVGDIVLSVNGKRMENARQLEVNVYRYPARSKISLQLLRGDDTLTAAVEVAERANDPLRFADLVSPENNLVDRLGILVIPIDKKLAEMLPDLRNSFGLVVAAGGVRDLSTGTGLEVGDVIYSVNGSPVTTVEALRKQLDELKPGEAPVFQIERSGRLMFVAIELD
jgi:serine protease Do